MPLVEDYLRREVIRGSAYGPRVPLRDNLGQSEVDNFKVALCLRGRHAREDTGKRDQGCLLANNGEHTIKMDPMGLEAFFSLDIRGCSRSVSSLGTFFEGNSRAATV